MSTDFAPTNSFCYRFARYDVLPRVLQEPGVQAGQPFRLVELVRRIMDERLTPEQQATTFVRAQNKELMAVGKAIKWYVPFIAKNTGQLEPLGEGMYRLPDVEPSAEEAEDAALDDGEPEAVSARGFVYAFSFPVLIKDGAPFPIKIGKTASDVEQRVAFQCRSSAVFEKPVILGHWQVDQVGSFEAAIHAVLKVRGKWRANAPGQEWFDTTLREIEQIIESVRGDT